MDIGDGADDQVIAMERSSSLNSPLAGRDFRVLQLETTVGSAIKKFDNTLAIEVDRKIRYLPVKVHHIISLFCFLK